MIEERGKNHYLSLRREILLYTCVQKMPLLFQDFITIVLATIFTLQAMRTR